MRIVDAVENLAAPVVLAHGCTLWDVEYIKEGADRFLRVYIDKEDGVSINDCEAISVALDPMLDEADLIGEHYIFEVSSAGAERQLKKPRDFERCIGRDVTVKLYSPRDNQKEFAGVLTDYRDGQITIRTGEASVTFEKSQYSAVKLRIEF